MPELSPAAQAVWDAYELVNCDEFAIDPRRAGLAAAIEALADQVVPKEQVPPMLRSPGLERLCQRQYTRFELLAIANELRGQDQPSSGTHYSHHGRHEPTRSDSATG